MRKIIPLLCVMLMACQKEASTQITSSNESTPFASASDANSFAKVASSSIFRSVDGTGNNLKHPAWGSFGAPIVRNMPAGYGDGVSTPGGASRPNPRTVSNVVVAQEESMPNTIGYSDYLWQWGQFIDHELTFTDTGSDNSMAISVPAGDSLFDPNNTGTQTIPFARSIFDEASAPRTQLNKNTAYIDGSMIYGSDAKRASFLRSHAGGHLKTSKGNYPPYNTGGFENALDPNGKRTDEFLAGDVRVNEQVALTAMHTLFLREHNRLADEIGALIPEASDETIYQTARALVGAEVAAITYNDFLPLLLGPGAISEYNGYDPNVDPGIEIFFSTASYRVGHTLLSPQVQRLDANLRSIAAGPLSIRDAFFTATSLPTNGGVEPILRGLSQQKAQKFDVHVINDVRNFLFGLPGQGGLDLPALNIQRGRDHGLCTYNEARLAYGLLPVNDFADITTDATVSAHLASVYNSVDDLDPWLAGLAEDPAPGAVVGPLVQIVLADQFRRVRDGDRYFYKNVMPAAIVAWADSQTLAKITRRNSSVATRFKTTCSWCRRFF